MTKKRFDNHGTEFSLWLREQPKVDSSIGYTATNIDYVWRNYKTGDWMIIEEKCFMAKPERWQKEIFEIVNQCCKHDPKFRGFHLIQFKNTSPEYGEIFLDGKEISEANLIEFLQFKFS